MNEKQEKCPHETTCPKAVFSVDCNGDAWLWLECEDCEADVLVLSKIENIEVT